MRLIFMFIIIVLILSATATGVIYYGAHYPDPRTLTDEEQVYAKTIFGDALDYTSVHMHFNTMYTIISSLTLGNSIHIKVSDLGADSTSDLTLSEQGRFMLIHELGHVYQYQQSGWGYLINSFSAQFQALIQTGSRTNAYDWRSRVSDRDAYTDWNTEEQAEAIAEYAHERDVISAGSKVRDPSIQKLGCIIPLLTTTWCVK